MRYGDEEAEAFVKAEEEAKNKPQRERPQRQDNNFKKGGANGQRRDDRNHEPTAKEAETKTGIKFSGGAGPMTFTRTKPKTEVTQTIEEGATLEKSYDFKNPTDNRKNRTVTDKYHGEEHEQNDPRGEDHKNGGERKQYNEARRHDNKEGENGQKYYNRENKEKRGPKRYNDHPVENKN